MSDFPLQGNQVMEHTRPPGSGSAQPQFYRVGWTLEAQRQIRLSSYQGAVVHALIAAASGRARGGDPAVPDGLMLDAPEQCRLQLQTGDRYAFGCTLIAH